MRYCTRCKCLYKNDQTESCPVCGRKTITDPSHFSPVRIVTANGFELERIRAALEDGDIPYSYQEAPRDAGIQILNAAPPENCDVFVPLSAYQQAVELLIGIGALQEDAIPDEADPVLQKAQKEAAEEELPPQKAKMIRIVSGIGFLLLLVLVVWLTDFVMEFIIQLFA